MPVRTISKAELAKLAGVSKAAITKQCAKGLKAALVGDRINLDHPTTAAWLAARGVKIPKTPRAPTKAPEPVESEPPGPTRSAAEQLKRAAKPTAPRRAEGDEDGPNEWGETSDEELERVAEMLRPLVERFGTARACRDWMEALKGKELITKTRLDNEETKRSLISRELVKVHILSFLEETSKRLLIDMPKTLVARMFALARNGATHEEANLELRATVSSHLDAVNKKLSKTLRDAARRAAEKNAGGNGGGMSLARGAD